MALMLEDTKAKIFWAELLKPYAPKGEAAFTLWKEMKPFINGQEREWQQEIDQLVQFFSVVKENEKIALDLETLFNNSVDITNLLAKIVANGYQSDSPVFDGFTLKRFLWYSYNLSNKILELFHNKSQSLLTYSWFNSANLAWENWLKLFQANNSSGVYYPHFAIADIDNEDLKQLRREKKLRLARLKGLEASSCLKIEAKYNIKINYERYFLILANDKRLDELKLDKRISFIRNQGDELVYYVNLSVEEETVQKELLQLDEEIKKLEKARMNELLLMIKDELKNWQTVQKDWAKFEVLYQKAKMASDIAGTKPILKQVDKPSFIAKQAVHPHLRKLWQEKGREMLPIDISLVNSVTIIYGANMSGKSIALRTVGLLQVMAQYGFYVPAERFEFTLLSHVTIIAGDYQDVENDLSSFGGEINRISKDLAYNNVLYLLDEIGTGTNPIEGEALAYGILRFLKNKADSLSVLTSHYPNLIAESNIGLYEVKKHQVISVTKGKMVYEAIQQAEQLGLALSIITVAKEYLQRSDRGNDDGEASS